MRDPRCWREVLIRGGMTTIMVAILYFSLDIDPWVWIIPVAVAGMVVLRWSLRPASFDDFAPDDEDQQARHGDF